ncbi:MAG: discoidin domain-containing protein [Deltaproteobacteria bacterium]|nr:MAG: discoidin domain-containing protein [Deltaproteobacteria bacterium]
MLAILAVLSTVALASRVDVERVEASSVYPPEQGIRYDAKMATDGKLATAWIEGEEGSGLGSWLKLHAAGETELTGVRIWGGLWSSYDFWTRANRPKTLEVKFDDGSTETLTLQDKMEAQNLMFSKPRKTTSIRIKIKEVYSGNTWFDTAISEVQLLSAAPADHHEPTGFAFSSKLADDGDGNYKPENMTDGVLDSMWCEGSDEGDGTGEWVEVSFGSTVPVKSLSMINGVGGNLKAWMNSNRATKGRLTFSDGSTHDIDIKNGATLQEIPFPEKKTSSVRLTFTEVYKGKEYNDLCVSELYFR